MVQGPRCLGSSHQAPGCRPASQELLPPQIPGLGFFWGHLLSSRTTSVPFHTVDRSFHSVDQVIVAEKGRKKCSLPQAKGFMYRTDYLPAVTATAGARNASPVPGMSLHEQQFLYSIPSSITS